MTRNQVSNKRDSLIEKTLSCHLNEIAVTCVIWSDSSVGKNEFVTVAYQSSSVECERLNKHSLSEFTAKLKEKFHCLHFTCAKIISIRIRCTFCV